MYWSYLPFLLNPMIQSYTCAGQWSRHRRRRAAKICMNIMYPLKTINLSAFFETVTPGWQGGKVLSCYCEDSSLLWRQTILFKFDNLCLLLYGALKICKGMIPLPVIILSTIELFFSFFFAYHADHGTNNILKHPLNCGLFTHKLLWIIEFNDSVVVKYSWKLSPAGQLSGFLAAYPCWQLSMRWAWPCGGQYCGSICSFLTWRFKQKTIIFLN